MERAGFKESENGSKADYYIVNTCTVTSSADRQSRYLIRSSKRKNPSGCVVVTGCYAHSNRDDIKKIKEADLILDNIEKQSIANFILPGNRRFKAGPFEISDFKSHTRAFVQIQDGCNNFCSFCKVPFVRGRSRSRQLTSIVKEVRRLRDKGYKEVVLTGICLGDYGKSISPKIDLVNLIDELEGIEGILRIRLSSIEAKDVSRRLIDKMKTSEKLCPHLHVPFQSGDNKILKLMNRRDTREGYLRLIERLKKSIKDLSITADIMIGFLEEKDENFLNTLDFLKEVVPSRVHIFTFQPRDGTLLSNCQIGIPPEVIKQRYSRLKEFSESLGLRFRSKYVNKRLRILFEKKEDGLWKGYSDNYIKTCLKADHKLSLTNTLKEVLVTDAGPQCLFSRI